MARYRWRFLYFFLYLIPHRLQELSKYLVRIGVWTPIQGRTSGGEDRGSKHPVLTNGMTGRLRIFLVPQVGVFQDMPIRMIRRFFGQWDRWWKNLAYKATRMSQEISKWVITYLGLYTGYWLYWGYNPFINLLPASWDMQVVSAAHTNRFFDASYLRISDPSTVSPQLECCTTMLGFWYLITRIPANPPGFYRM